MNDPEIRPRLNMDETFTFCTGVLTFVIPSIVAVQVGDKSREGMLIIHLSSGQSFAIKDAPDNGTEIALIRAIESYHLQIAKTRLIIDPPNRF